jgi:hypothetical protein
MTFSFDHTSHIEKQIVKLRIASPTNNIVLKLQAIILMNTKMVKFLVSMLYKAFTLFWAKHFL